MYADPTLTTKPELLSQRGGAFYSEAAVGLISSLFAGAGAGAGARAVHAVNVRNAGRFHFLADEAVIEVSCEVSPAGATPLESGPVRPPLSGLIAAVSAYEELAVAAAIHGGRSRVYTALLAHPLVGQHELADALTDKLIAANSDYLAWAR